MIFWCTLIIFCESVYKVDITNSTQVKYTEKTFNNCVVTKTI